MANIGNIKPPSQSQLLGPGGTLTPEWQRHFNGLFQYLNQNVGQNGYVLPGMSANSRDAMGSVQEGTLILNTDAHTIQVYLGGAWKTITAS